MTAPVTKSSGAPAAQTECATGGFALKLKLAAQTRATAPLPVAQAQQASFYSTGQITPNGAMLHRGNSNVWKGIKMIKAIETKYKGYRFRSRLEARWAVFFDACDLKWEYEPEGFETSSGWYLPDFWLPDVRGGLWVEIKTEDSKSEKDKTSEVEKLISVIEGTTKSATIFRGDPYHVSFTDLYDRAGVDDWSANAIIYHLADTQEAGVYDCPYSFCVCPRCGKVGFEFDGRGARVCTQECDEITFDGFDYGSHPDKGYSYNHPKILKAAITARAARFEHGERPR